MSHASETTRTFNCPDCDFSSSSQTGLCCHRTKSHRTDSSSVKSVSVVRYYPEGKNFICCLCGNTMLNYPNLKRHFQTIHPDTVLSTTIRCLVCNKDFSNAQAASVHCKRAHGVSKTDPINPPSPTPIMSCIDTNLGPSATSDVSGESFSFPGVGLRRSTRRARNNNHPSSVDQSILPSCASQPSLASYDLTPNKLTSPANQSKSQGKIHGPCRPNDFPNQPDINSSSFSRFIRECENIPPSIPERIPQTVGLTSSPISATKTTVPTANEPSRFSLPASGPSPRTYQRDRTSNRRYRKPTSADFFSPRWLQHSPSPSSPAAQADVSDIPLNFTTSSNGSTNEEQPPVYSEVFPSPNHDDICTQSQPTDLPAASDLSAKKDLFKDKWTDIFSSDITWSEFCSNCDQFAVETRSLALEMAANFSPTSHRRKPLQRCNRPSGRRPAFRHRPLLLNPAEAQRIQTLYRHSKKKAARKILSPNCPSYSGSIESAESFFRNTFSLRNCDITSLQNKLNDLTTPAPIDDSLFSPPTNKEIRRKLSSSANTSPGPDCVEYRHLKRVDPSCSILSLLFNHCFKRRDVPPAWKSATTVLIHKKDSTDDPSNFRPIALMSCLYKLVMGIIAKRLTSWAIDNDLMSKEQKSARPSEGCYEHSFLLQSIIADARRSHKNVFVAWLDLRNAFGSIPHSAISTTLTHIGVPLPLIEMICNSYSGATTRIRTSTGFTADIPILSGVKQGCPLSPIIFNLTIDLILRAIKQTASDIGPAKVHDIPFSVLAYADDLVVISRKKDRLQKLLNAASSTATDLGLSFRPDKCASISLTCSNSSVCSFELNEFLVQDKPIPPLDRENPYKYLGVPIGLIHDPDNIFDLVQDLTRDLESIEKSLLAPWQKLDMIRTFLQPSLTFALRSGFPKKEHLLVYRSHLVATVRRICALPTRASASYIFAHKRVGGLGLLDPTLEADVQAIIHGVKMLSCSDPTVRNIANAEVNQTVRLASRSNPTPALKSKYLSSLPDNRLTNLRYNIQSLWTRVRKSSRNLGVEIQFKDNGLPVLSTETTGSVLAKEASRFLHFHVQDRFASSLLALPDQGKVGRALTTDTFANGSTWQYNGINIRFRDWRFIHRARLNCLPVNNVKCRWSNSCSKCRHCDSVETLPHVLCHCRPNMPSILRRHNAIVDRIVNAVKCGTITTDQQVSAANSRLRPDIIVEDDNKVLIIDVCCPFDNNAEALRDAEQRKLNKYEGLKQFFVGQGKQCQVFGFVVGALGSWHPANENVLRELGMSKRYRSLFRKLCCTDAIQGSTNIYREHLGLTDGSPVPVDNSE